MRNPEEMQLELCSLAEEAKQHANGVSSCCLPGSQPPAKPANLIHTWSGAAVSIQVVKEELQRQMVAAPRRSLLVILHLTKGFRFFSNFFDEVEQSEAALPKHLYMC